MDKQQHFICDCYYENIHPIGTICPKCKKAGQSHFKIKIHQVPCSKCGVLVERSQMTKTATCFECKRDRASAYSFKLLEAKKKKKKSRTKVYNVLTMS